MQGEETGEVLEEISGKENNGNRGAETRRSHEMIGNRIGALGFSLGLLGRWKKMQHGFVKGTFKKAYL